MYEVIKYNARCHKNYCQFDDLGSYIAVEISVMILRKSLILEKKSSGIFHEFKRYLQELLVLYGCKRVVIFLLLNNRYIFTRSNGIIEKKKFKNNICMVRILIYCYKCYFYNLFYTLCYRQSFNLVSSRKLPLLSYTNSKPDFKPLIKCAIQLIRVLCPVSNNHNAYLHLINNFTQTFVVSSKITLILNSSAQLTR